MKTIKTLGVGMLLVGLMGAGVAFKTGILDNTSEVIKETVIETVIEEDGYGNLDKLILEAQEASQDEVNAKLDTYKGELLKEIEDEVKAEYIKEIEGTISTEAY